MPKKAIFNAILFKVQFYNSNILGLFTHFTLPEERYTLCKTLVSARVARNKKTHCSF